MFSIIPFYFGFSGFPADLGTVIYALLQIVITALNALFVDTAGRKPLLLVTKTHLATNLVTQALLLISCCKLLYFS